MRETREQHDEQDWGKTEKGQPQELLLKGESPMPQYRCNTEGCSVGDCENCLAVARLLAISAAVDVFLAKHSPFGSKSGREDYGEWVTAADLWALHIARLPSPDGAA